MRQERRQRLVRPLPLHADLRELAHGDRAERGGHPRGEVQLAEVHRCAGIQEEVNGRGFVSDVLADEERPEPGVETPVDAAEVVALDVGAVGMEFGRSALAGRGPVAFAAAPDPPAHLRRPDAGSCLWALSPHAPYTVGPELFRRAVHLATTHRAPLAIHLAESREEMELLQRAAGPFVEALQALGAWDASAMQPGRRPMDFLRAMAALPRGLIVHGNYLADDEIGELARCRENLSVVYCPRTHAYFGHPEHPLRRMLAEGVAVAIGTDGRASNPDLSVLEELRFLRRAYPDLAGDVILRLGTLAGARSLGLDGQTGSLAPGKRADLAVVALPEANAAAPHDLLFDSNLPVVGTICAGEWVFGAEDTHGRTAQ